MSPAAFEGVDLLGTVERLSIPSYAIDRQGIIRWVNPAARALARDCEICRRSARAKNATPRNATVLGDDWPEEVARLRKRLDGEIVVDGSRRLSRALIGMGLVDELRLLVYPVGARCRTSPVRGDAGTRSRCVWSNRVRSGEAW